MTVGNIIGGSAGPPSTIVSPIHDPVTGQEYATAVVSRRAEVDAAMQAADAALEEWRRTTPGRRQDLLLRLCGALRDDADGLVAEECRNTGKSPDTMRRDEIGQILDQIPFLAGAARCLSGPAAGEYLTGYTSYVRREPIGVCAQVTPWNYPLLMAVWQCVPAIACGNTVVLKPSELTPVTTVRLAELAADILPGGVLNVVCGDRDTGRAMMAHPTPAMVSLTGSVRAGREVAGAAAAGVKRVRLELGGKAPVIVFADADIDRTATEIAEAGYYNAGQDCLAATRVLVERNVHDELVSALADRTAGTRCGPLISESHRDRVAGFLDRLPAHARALVGGRRADGAGYFLAPALVTGVRHGDEIAREEVFGPVITVEEFADEHEAVCAANAVEYGLAASVWTHDHGRALRMSARLDFGCVWVNTHQPVPAEMPHGGFKRSGYGKDMSMFSVEEYTRIKHVLSDNRV